jgi:predicted HTH domain antitoxin
MSLKTLEVKQPVGFEWAVHLSKQELNQNIRLMAALKMFELGKLSSGKAAELAGMTRVQFLETCGQYKVSVFNYSPEELEKELAADLDTVRKAKK